MVRFSVNWFKLSFVNWVLLHMIWNLTALRSCLRSSWYSDREMDVNLVLMLLWLCRLLPLGTFPNSYCLSVVPYKTEKRNIHKMSASSAALKPFFHTNWNSLLCCRTWWHRMTGSLSISSYKFSIGIADFWMKMAKSYRGLKVQTEQFRKRQRLSSCLDIFNSFLNKHLIYHHKLSKFICKLQVVVYFTLDKTPKHRNVLNQN